jgi:hypothetical protein
MRQTQQRVPIRPEVIALCRREGFARVVNGGSMKALILGVLLGAGLAVPAIAVTDGDPRDTMPYTQSYDKKFGQWEVARLADACTLHPVGGSQTVSPPNVAISIVVRLKTNRIEFDVFDNKLSYQDDQAVQLRYRFSGRPTISTEWHDVQGSGLMLFEGDDRPLQPGVKFEAEADEFLPIFLQARLFEIGIAGKTKYSVTIDTSIIPAVEDVTKCSYDAFKRTQYDNAHPDPSP